ncbi:MAG: hypothetical protein HKN13_02735 [Rhodothermales bacterium]|nr:hypothetical protein [Rhodothermales bacterium]
MKKFRKARGVPLLKDPIAIFSSEWLAERLGMNVVVMIRHPAAFVSSIVARNKKENWRFDFKNMVEQPLLIEHLLKEFEPDILEFLNSDGDIVDESILLWSIIHAVIAQYRDNHPEWTFLRHEDVSRRPEEIFQNLYEQLGLEWTAEIRQFVQESTRGSNATTENTHAFNTVRDSSANLSAWKRILTQAEIDRIEAGTRRVAAQFYSDEDW